MNLNPPPNPMARDVPTPRTGRLFGHLGTLRRKGLLPSYVDWWRELGDVYRIRLGPHWLYMLAHPDHVRHVQVSAAASYVKGAGYARLRRLIGNGVVVSEGRTWRDSRSRMQPLFLKASVERFCHDVGQCVAGMLVRWERMADQRQPVNVHQQFLPLTMQVITRCMLGSDLSHHAREMGPLVSDALAFIANRTFSTITIPLFVPLPSHRRFRRAMKVLNRTIGGSVCKNEGQQDSPLLEALLGKIDGRQLGTEQVQAEVLNIVFAGYETTALALTWALYLLTSHEGVFEQLGDEAARVIGGEIPTVSEVAQLSFTRSVFRETLRLYPPAWIIARQAVEEDDIDGFKVPAGALVLNCQYITHRHADFWDEPEAFRPARFSAESSGDRHPFAYFPFGAGARSCLGERFAILEATITLAMLAARFRIERCDKQPIQPVGTGTLYPSRPVLIRLSRR